MDKGTKARIKILIGLVLILIGILVFYTYPALSWEEMTVWDNSWSSSSEADVTSYSGWDSRSGTYQGYIQVYRSGRYLWAPPNELERQEIRRESWWGDEYKEWLGEQGVSTGEMIGW